nr:hypothetical protein Hi04_10k_c3826_00004 [uncultured bacterium]
MRWVNGLSRSGVLEREDRTRCNFVSSRLSRADFFLQLPLVEIDIAAGRSPDCRDRVSACQTLHPRWHRGCAERRDVEKVLHEAAYTASLVIEGVAVVVVAYGALEAFVGLLTLPLKPSIAGGSRRELWRRFGVWLLLGLEFELAADIISSVVSPTWKDIGELAAIAVIRTFLNYFLEKDLEHTAREGESPARAASRTEAA